jgi:hypothetical protein
VDQFQLPNATRGNGFDLAIKLLNLVFHLTPFFGNYAEQSIHSRSEVLFASANRAGILLRK